MNVSLPAPRAFAVTVPMVIGIAVPMTLAYLSTPLIGIVDIAVIGQLGDATLLGAVALGALMFDLLGTSLNFLRSGTTGLVAQATGAEDREGEALALWRALIFAAVAGFAVVALYRPLLSLFLLAMGPSEAVASATAQYYGVRVWATPLMFANFAILGWLLGLGRARTGLLLQLCLGLTNIAASVWFVLGLSYGVAGVAAASVLAEFITLVAGGVVVAIALGRRPRPRLAALLERTAFARMLAVNRDIFIRSMVLVGSFAVFTAVGARFGDVTLAANAILLNIFITGSYMLDGLATAAEQLAGRAVGARYRPAFDRAVRLTLRFGFAAAATLVLVILGGGTMLINALTTAQDVRTVALEHLVWTAVTPLAGVLAFIMDGVYIGATWSSTMRNMMLLSAAIFVAMLAVATPLLGNHGLWLAFVTFIGARGLTLLSSMPRRADVTFGRATAGS